MFKDKVRNFVEAGKDLGFLVIALPVIIPTIFIVAAVQVLFVDEVEID